MPFTQAPAGARRMTEWSSPAGLGRGRRGASNRMVQSRSTPSEAKPGSLWTWGPAPNPAATPRVCHRPPGCTRGSPHSSAHPGTLWCWLSCRLRRCDVAWCGPHLKPHQNYNRSRKFCFHHPGNVPVIRGNQAMVLAMVLLSLLGSVESMSYTAVHLQSRWLNIVSISDMIEGSYRSWDLYTTGQLVDSLLQKRKPVFIKRKWNHVVFSRATILSFHPILRYNVDLSLDSSILLHINHAASHGS